MNDRLRYALLLDRHSDVHTLICTGHYDPNNILLLDEHKEWRAHYIASRNIIITILALKRRKVTKMIPFDRFLIRLLGFHCYAAIRVAEPYLGQKSTCDIQWGQPL